MNQQKNGGYSEEIRDIIKCCGLGRKYRILSDNKKPQIKKERIRYEKTI